MNYLIRWVEYLNKINSGTGIKNVLFVMFIFDACSSGNFSVPLKMEIKWFIFSLINYHYTKIMHIV